MEMKFTDNDNSELTEDVGPHPFTCNTLTTLTMNNSTKEFRELFPDKKPTELLLLGHHMQILLYRIDIIPDSH